MKVLYVANNSSGSYLQLKRFLAASNGSFDIRVAGYTKALLDIPADYTLDCLNDWYGRNTYSGQKSNVDRFTDEVATFKPDLIINDFDFYTSYVATELNIPYWLVSSSLLYFGLPSEIRCTVKMGRHFLFLLRKNKGFVNHNYQINNAERLLVYSCLGDMRMSPPLNPKFEWVRPYHVKAVPSNESPGFIGAMMTTDKALIKYLAKLGDTFLYSPFEYETFANITHRHYLDDRYKNNLDNCYLYFSRGESSFVADAFYNEKYSMIFPDVKNIETIINAYFLEYFGLVDRIYTRKDFEQINNLSRKDLNIKISLNSNIKLLHHYIEELCF